MKKPARIISTTALALILCSVMGTSADAFFPGYYYGWGPQGPTFVAPPVRPGGLPSVNTFNMFTGGIDQQIDVGLMASGLPPQAFVNSAGGVTVLRQLKPGKK